MTCMMPIAPAFDVIGFPSSNCVRPPLSMRITARIQDSATLKRREASLIRGAQRSTKDDELIACSFANSDAFAVIAAATTGALPGTLAKAGAEDATRVMARIDAQTNLRDAI